jgi:hypothetical protein
MERETELNQAIDSALDPTAIDAFLKGLDQRGARIDSLVEASSDLTAFLPGSAFKPGTGTFATSFLSEHHSLDDVARRRVEDHYRSLVESLPQMFKNKYPRVFR